MTLAQENRRKYLKPPTWEQIEAFRVKLEVSMAQFERFYGIPKETLKNVKMGKRNLPAEKWAIVYEEQVPLYGIGFTDKKQERTGVRTKSHAPTPTKPLIDKLTSLE